MTPSRVDRLTSTDLPPRLACSGRRPERSADRSETRRTLRAILPAELRAAGLARSLVREQLRTWELTAVGADVVLVTSELAANAIAAASRAGSDHIVFRLTARPGAVLVAVANRAAPAQLVRSLLWSVLTVRRRLLSAGLAEGGRGLAIVTALSRRTGCYRAGGWTVVWAEVPAPGPAGRARPWTSRSIQRVRITPRPSGRTPAPPGRAPASRVARRARG